MLLKIALIVPFTFCVGLNNLKRDSEPDVVLETPQEAEAIRDFFATPYQNQVVPLNWKNFRRLYMIHGGPIYGKALMVFDIGEDGLPKNLRILQRNRDLLFGPKMKRLFEESLQFPTGNPKKNVRYEVGFCERHFCNLYFERISGPVAPLILGYKLPFSDFSYKKGTACADVTVKFDVTKQGRAKNVNIISETETKQFGIWLKKNMKHFKFEKKKPATEIEMVVRFELMEYCDQ